MRLHDGALLWPFSFCFSRLGFFTIGGYVSPTFLASPITMVREGWLLFVEFNFIHDIGMTVWRVMGGFILAAAIAVPLGIMMGAHKGSRLFSSRSYRFVDIYPPQPLFRCSFFGLELVSCKKFL